MEERVAATISAFDPISKAGLVSQLRHRQEMHLVSADQAKVTIIVVERIDDQAVQTIRAVRRNGCRAVLVVTEVDTATLLTAVEAGCSGVVRRAEATPDRLVDAVRAAAAGDGTLPPDLLGHLMAQMAKPQQPQRQTLPPPGFTGSPLTAREVRVLQLVADGRPTYDIAREMSYSERTVKNIIHDVTNRLRLRNRAHAVAYAVREGLI